MRKIITQASKVIRGQRSQKWSFRKYLASYLSYNKKSYMKLVEEINMYKKGNMHFSCTSDRSRGIRLVKWPFFLKYDFL